MNRLPKILFISHDSSLTGAPILLLNLIRLFRARNHNISILLMRGGKLEKEFTTLGETHILKPADYQKGGNFLGKFLDYGKFLLRRRRILRRVLECDIIFNNTVTNGSVLPYFENKPVVTYVHELQTIILQNAASARATFELSKVLICPSKAVARNLELSHQIPASKISYLPYYFPRSLAGKSRGGSHFERYKIPAGRFYVVGMGTATRRKGFDLFVETCRKLADSGDEFYFIWIGDFVEPEMKQWYERIGGKGLEGHFLLTGELPHDPGNLAPWDVFLLTSREDPYPLVVIEAAQVGLPSIYFDGTGGIGDFIDEDTGWRIPQIETDAVVALLLDIRKRKAEVRMKGEKAKLKASLLHENDDEIFKLCNSIIEGALK